MKSNNIKSLIKFFLTFLLFTPIAAFAQYSPLVGLPGIGTGVSNFDAYIETIYAVTITVAAMLAVIKIVIAGVKYMTTDIITAKGDAKSDIKGAILGLLVVLSAVLVIEVINPQINNVDLSFSRHVTPPAPVRTPTAQTTALQNIQAICDSDPDIECLRQRCDYFDSAEAFGFWGYLAAPADIALNRVGCEGFCDFKGGELTGDALSGGVCVYPEGDPADAQQAIADHIALDPVLCSGAGCRIETCPVIRFNLGGCEDWCERVQEGVHISSSFTRVAAQCVIPN